jgi:hypothetical protein
MSMRKIREVPRLTHELELRIVAGVVAVPAGRARRMRGIGC